MIDSDNGLGAESTMSNFSKGNARSRSARLVGNPELQDKSIVTAELAQII